MTRARTTAVAARPSGRSSADRSADVDLAPDWFDVPVCRNCGAARSGPFCGQCGQKAAKRLRLKDAGSESWERLRLFEKDGARTIWRLILSPGLVARDYVRGRRAAHMHPLKLLVALVAILVVMLATNQYFQHFTFGGQDRDVGRMAERVMAYANWSFTLGIFAIFLGSRIGMLGFRADNSVEHAVLAIYCQSLVLALVIVNLLPTLIWRDPQFIVAHKQASALYLPVIKLAVVGRAYAQFFGLDVTRDWPRLGAACLIYAAANWLLLRSYAAAILWIVNQSA